MRTQLIALGALAAVLSAGVANASPDPVAQTFVEHAKVRAEALVNGCGVDLGRNAVTVQAYIGSEGRLKSVRVLGSTGPRDSDRVIEQALKGLQLYNVPAQLIDAKITFFLGRDGAHVAQAN